MSIMFLDISGPKGKCMIFGGYDISTSPYTLREVIDSVVGALDEEFSWPSDDELNRLSVKYEYNMNDDAAYFSMDPTNDLAVLDLTFQSGDFWLASVWDMALVDSSWCSWEHGCYCVSSEGVRALDYNSSISLCLRPIVCLEASVQINKTGEGSFKLS